MPRKDERTPPRPARRRSRRTVPIVPTSAPGVDPDGLTPIQRYQLEKAKADERNAPKRAAQWEAIRAANARADDVRAIQARGGRKRKHGPQIHIPSRAERDDAERLVGFLRSGA